MCVWLCVFVGRSWQCMPGSIAINWQKRVFARLVKLDQMKRWKRGDGWQVATWALPRHTFYQHLLRFKDLCLLLSCWGENENTTKTLNAKYFFWICMCTHAHIWLNDNLLTLISNTMSILISNTNKKSEGETDANMSVSIKVIFFHHVYLSTIIWMNELKFY